MKKLKVLFGIYTRMLKDYAITGFELLLVRIKYGNIIIRSASTDLHVFQQLFLYNDYELKSLDFTPKTIIDAGAYVGYSAIYFHLAYPKAKIACIEPSTENFEALKYNTRKVPGIVLFNKGLWSKPSFLKIEDRKTGQWGFRTIEVPENQSWDVSTVDVNMLLTQLQTDEIDIFKIDIEGSEYELFKDNPPWVSKVRVFIIEFHERIVPGCIQVFREAISGHTYKEFQRGENLIFVRMDWPN